MIRLCAPLPEGAGTATGLAATAALGVWGSGVSLSPDVPEAEAAALGERFLAAGLQLAWVECAANLCAPQPEPAAHAVADLATVLRLADRAGAGAVCIGAGHRDPARPDQGFVAHPDNLSQAALDQLAAGCRAALEQSPGTSRLLVRTAVLGPMHNLLRAVEAVRRVGHGRFGILLDPARLTDLDNYFDNGSFLRRAVAQLGPAIGLVRAADVLLEADGLHFGLVSAPLGRGALDYRALIEALADLPGDVPLCVDAGPPAIVGAALDHLRGLIGRVGRPGAP